MPVINTSEAMTPGDVARLFNVDPKTVSRWAKTGKLSSFRTPGGHHRFRKDEVMAFYHGEDTSASST